MSYHIRHISKGVLGEPSKIREELEEYEDAVAQGNKIMASVELSDLYGALEALARRQGLCMEDLQTMAKATERAFKLRSRR